MPRPRPEVEQQPLWQLLLAVEPETEIVILELEFLKEANKLVESRVDSVCGRGNWDINQDRVME